MPTHNLAAFLGGQKRASSYAEDDITKQAHWRIVEANPLDGFRLFVRFVDGTTGTVDLSGLVHSSRAGVFATLSDPDIFRQVFVERGAVTWPGELDLAPDAMYTEIKENGNWILR